MIYTWFVPSYRHESVLKNNGFDDWCKVLEKQLVRRISAPLLDDAEEQQLPGAMTDEFFMYKYKNLISNRNVKRDQNGSNRILETLHSSGNSGLSRCELNDAYLCLFYLEFCPLQVGSFSEVLKQPEDPLVPHWRPTWMAQLCLGATDFTVFHWGPLSAMSPGVYGHNYQDARRPPSIGYGAR